MGIDSVALDKITGGLAEVNALAVRGYIEAYEAAKPPSPSVEGLIAELEKIRKDITNPYCCRPLVNECIAAIRQYFKGADND